MKLAAVKVIAAAARDDEILPEPLDKKLHEMVAIAVEDAAGIPAGKSRSI